MMETMNVFGTYESMDVWNSEYTESSKRELGNGNEALSYSRGGDKISEY